MAYYGSAISTKVTAVLVHLPDARATAALVRPLIAKVTVEPAHLQGAMVMVVLVHLQVLR